MSGSVVRFTVAADHDAERIAAILEALGYSAERVDGEHGPKATAYRIKRKAALWRLSERETEILEMTAAGLTLAEIAARLEVSKPTAKWHTHNLLAKADCPNREALLCRLLVDKVES